MKRLAFAFALALAPVLASAQTPPAAPTISVGGQGVVSRPPDVATLSISLVTDDADATRSTSQNNDLYRALIAKVATAGVASSAVTTSAYDVQFVPFPPKDLPPQDRQPRYGYVTTRNIAIVVAPIEKLGAVIDATAAAGATTFGGVRFDVRERTTLYREALAKAIQDARAQAQILAQAGGFHLGRMQSVSTGYEAFPGPVEGNFKVMAASAAPTVIGQTGPIEIRAQVNVVYVIAE